MKIECRCGATIVDQTDGQSNKAHLIADQEWFTMLEAIDAAVERSGPSAREKEAAAMAVRARIGRISRPVYQCRECGRLYVNDQANVLWGFLPDAGEAPRQLLSRREAV